MPSAFKANRNFARDLAKEPSYTEGLSKATEPAAAAARSFAPVRSGAYRDSIRVHEANGKVYLSAFDFKAHWIEFGSVNNPPSAPLRRGIQAAGLKFKESSK